MSGLFIWVTDQNSKKRDLRPSKARKLNVRSTEHPGDHAVGLQKAASLLVHSLASVPSTVALVTEEGLLWVLPFFLLEFDALLVKANPGLAWGVIHQVRLLLF